VGCPAGACLFILKTASFTEQTFWGEEERQRVLLCSLGWTQTQTLPPEPPKYWDYRHAFLILKFSLLIFVTMGSAVSVKSKSSVLDLKDFSLIFFSKSLIVYVFFT
jgi:hypothetical protein